MKKKHDICSQREGGRFVCTGKKERAKEAKRRTIARGKERNAYKEGLQFGRKEKIRTFYQNQQAECREEKILPDSWDLRKRVAMSSLSNKRKLGGKPLL